MLVMRTGHVVAMLAPLVVVLMSFLVIDKNYAGGGLPEHAGGGCAGAEHGNASRTLPR